MLCSRREGQSLPGPLLSTSFKTTSCVGKAELKGEVAGGGTCDPCFSVPPRNLVGSQGGASGFPVSLRGRRQGGRCIGRGARRLLEPQSLSVLGNRGEVRQGG